MTLKTHSRFEIGDHIVHYYYGVGKVVDIVEKGITTDKSTFYKVLTKDIVYWIPIDNEDVDHIEPIRPKQAFEKALKVLSQAPEPIANHHKTRKKRIHERWLIGTLPSRAKLLRDLHGRLKTERLSFSEKEMMEKVRRHYINEWIKSDDSINKKIAKKKIRTALKESLAKLKESTPQ
jgi:RNA polymerase-interacting CarD/CdnL/TRCF family regulator